MILKWTTEEDGYSVAERLLEGVIFAIDVELDLEQVKAKSTFAATDLFIISNVRPQTPEDESYLKRLGPEGTVAHWCNKVKDHAKRNGTELMTDEIFNLPEIQELWNKYHE